MKCIPEVVCDKSVFGGPIFPQPASSAPTSLLHLPECLSTRGVSLAFNLRGACEQINMLLLPTQPLWTPGCVWSLALAQNVNCLVAALHSGPVGLLWVEEKVSLFSSVMDFSPYDCWTVVQSGEFRSKVSRDYSLQSQAEFTSWVCPLISSHAQAGVEEVLRSFRAVSYKIVYQQMHKCSPNCMFITVSSLSM